MEDRPSFEEAPDFEDAEVREIRSPSSMPEGESVVKLKKNRRWLLPAIAGAVLILFILLLVSGGEKKESGVSLKAAKEIILKETPPLTKDQVLSALSKEGFLVTPGKPQGKLEIAVSVRREGIILRGGGRRELLLWSEFNKS